MKCTECKDYKECRRKYDLRRKRTKCSKAKDIYVPTNADRIRAMSDEELAQFIPNWSYTDACKCGEHYVDCNNECEKCVAEWLKQPYKEET